VKTDVASARTSPATGADRSIGILLARPPERASESTPRAFQILPRVVAPLVIRSSADDVRREAPLLYPRRSREVAEDEELVARAQAVLDSISAIRNAADRVELTEHEHHSQRLIGAFIAAAGAQVR
jgi:hypothetical protein